MQRPIAPTVVGLFVILLGFGAWLLFDATSEPSKTSSEHHVAEAIAPEQGGASIDPSTSPPIEVSPFKEAADPKEATKKVGLERAKPSLEGNLQFSVASGAKSPAPTHCEMTLRSYSSEQATQASALPAPELTIAGDIVLGPESIQVPRDYKWPVPQHGTYQASLTFDSVFNSAEWIQSTTQKEFRTWSMLADQVLIRITGEESPPPVHSMVARGNASFGHATRQALKQSENTWIIQGPIILPVDVIVQFADPEVREHTFRVQGPEYTITIGNQHELTVRVEDSRTRAPLTGAKVSCQVFPPNRSFTVRDTTDIAGSAKFPFPHLINFTQSTIVLVTAEGFKTARVEVPILTTQKLTISLVPEDALCGYLERSNQDPVVGARVYIAGLFGVVNWGITDALGKFSLQVAGSSLGPCGTADPPFADSPYAWGIFIQDGNYSGMIAPIEWKPLVQSNWRHVIDRRDITVQVVRASDGTPYSGAQIRLIPRSDQTLFTMQSIDGTESNSDLAQAKFRVLNQTDWSASVLLTGSEHWVPYTISIDEGDDVKITVDSKQALGFLVRDMSGDAVKGVKLQVRHLVEQPLHLTTDEEGRAEVLVEPGKDHRLLILDGNYARVGINQYFYQAAPKFNEIIVSRRMKIGFTYSSFGIEQPERAVVACYGPADNEFISLVAASGSYPMLHLNDAVRRIVVFASGCRPGETSVHPIYNERHPPVNVKLEAGPKVEIPRTLLPFGYVHPIKAITKARAIPTLPTPQPEYLEQQLQFFNSEFAPPDGDILFGPLTPGTYELKIADANGKVLWEDTREVK